MIGLQRRLSALLLLCFFVTDGWALSGPETAQLLNKRMAATPDQCAGGTPPFACSGVLVRPMADNHPQPFWLHDEEAGVRGTERFHFLRNDGAGVPASSEAGYILMDQLSAADQGKRYHVVDDCTAPGSVMVRNWAEDEPAKLAIQALYYDKRIPHTLLVAQRGQLAYFHATGVWLPLVRVAPKGSTWEFGFSQQEQLYNGYEVATRLNVRYAATAMTCPDGRAGYYCNGVLLRTMGLGAFHVWNPSPNSERIEGVSFSYARRDMQARSLVYPRGYAIRELSAPALRPFKPACMYPVDGSTQDGPKGGACTIRDTCEARGVKDLASWLALYEASPRKGCALSLSERDLALMVEIRQHLPILDPWNEVVMEVWPQDMGGQLPIEAFIYSLKSHLGSDGLQGGRDAQRDYLEQAGRYLPLLRTDLEAPSGEPFSYDPDDQVSP